MFFFIRDINIILRRNSIHIITAHDQFRKAHHIFSKMILFHRDFEDSLSFNVLVVLTLSYERSSPHVGVWDLISQKRPLIPSHRGNQ